MDADKYEEVMNLLGTPEDEPLFILRGQDILALQTIEFYEDLAEKAGCDPSFLENLRQVKNEFNQFQVIGSARMKRPD